MGIVNGVEAELALRAVSIATPNFLPERLDQERAGFAVVAEPALEVKGYGQDPLPKRHLWKHVFDEMKRAVVHSPAKAARAEGSALA